MGYSLVLVEDKTGAKSSLAPGLQAGGHQVAVAHSSDSAVRQVSGLWPDAVILDVVDGMSDLNKVCHALDELYPHIPRLVLVGKNVPQTLKTDFERDAVLAAPYTPAELSRRLATVAAPSTKRFWRLGDIVLDVVSHQVLRGGQNYSLTPKEFKLLSLLAENSGQIVSRREIMNKVWETDYLGDTRTLDVHICWIRQKIEANPKKPRRLLTLRGVGYRLLADHPT
jgi:DNA-binding response OmpR family regulator